MLPRQVGAMNISEERSTISYHKENPSPSNVAFYREREGMVTLAISDCADKLDKTREGSEGYAELWNTLRSLESIQRQWLDLILSVEPLPYDETWDSGV